MSLSTILLACSIVAGLAGGISARYRRWGTGVADLAIGFFVAALFAVVTTVVLILAAGLDFFGIIHYVYLLIVVGFPIGVAWVVLPQVINAERRTPLLGWLLSAAAIAAGLIGLWATHVEPFRLQVDSQALGATGAAKPVVLGVIADLQTTTIGSHEEAALDAVLEGEPDIVVIPGDLFQLSLEELDERIPEFLGWMRRLTDAIDHVIIVNGNTDFPDVLEELADETGAVFLDDELAAFDVDGQQVVFAGFSWSDERTQGAIDPLLAQQLEETIDSDDLVVGLSHVPDTVLELATDNIDLMISGHTHGGQVAIPGVGPVLTFSEVPNIVAAGGLHVVNGTPIYVSTGVGLERGQAPQLRFGVPPSVALITVVPA